MTPIPASLDFEAWLKDNGHLLKPPIGNQRLFTEGQDFIVMVVGGPNQRTDFHVEPFEEWFYQLKGDMHINLMTESGPQRVDVGEGEMWLLPANVPHSPNRPQPGSVGLVIERVRPEGTMERFQWYCQQCDALVHEAEMQIRDVVKDVLPVFEAFYADEAARSCGACGALHPGKG